jgi:putative peptide zinc metalloprotease protein
VLNVVPLSIVAEGDEFLVGNPEQAEYVLLPPIGVRVIRMLQDGRSVDSIAAKFGPAVDVPDFVSTLIELGFVSDAETERRGQSLPGVTPRLVKPLFGRPAWAVYAGCAALVVGILAIHPAFFPTSQDIFFLPSPLASITGITLLTYALAMIHELCHWTAARAEGLDARVTVSRRLYFLAFETDLTQLWGLPRRRRYSALLAGMAFDVVVLCAALVLRLGLARQWWPLVPGADQFLAALAFVELAALVAQAYVFARTDLYAVLITATGCINLWRVNQLRLLRIVRPLSASQQRELAEAHPRDLSVARWYAWIYVAGLALAGGFFVFYFLPATVRLVGWLATTVAAAQVTTFDFWAALVFAVIIVSPHVLTVGVFAREVLKRTGLRRTA